MRAVRCRGSSRRRRAWSARGARRRTSARRARHAARRRSARVRPGVTRMRDAHRRARPPRDRGLASRPGAPPLPAYDVAVGTEAVLHRGRPVDGRPVRLVAFLDFDQELLAPRYRALGAGVVAAGAGRPAPRTARRTAGRAPRADPAPDATRWSWPRSTGTPGRSSTPRRATRRRSASRRSAGSPRSRGDAAAVEVACAALRAPTAARVLGPARRARLVRAPSVAELCDGFAPCRPRSRARARSRSGSTSIRSGSESACRSHMRLGTLGVWARSRFACSATRCCGNAPPRSPSSTANWRASSATMIDTMHEAYGVGLAAPQVGVQKRMYTYDVGDGPGGARQPRDRRRERGVGVRRRLPVGPRPPVEIVRPKVVTVRGLDLDGNEVSIEGDELMGRLIQHEIDHLDGDAAPRPARARGPQGGAARAARSSSRGRRARVVVPRRAPPSLTARAPSCGSSVLRHARRRGAAVAGARTTRATRSRSSSPSPTVAVGAGRRAEPSPVKEAAATRSASPCARPTGPRGRRRGRGRSDADVGVVVAFGQLLPPALLATVRHGFVNLHFSLLPRWRGAAPVERADPRRRHERRACASWSSKRASTPGPLYACARTPIGERRDRRRAARAARRARHDPARRHVAPRSGIATPTPQSGEPTYAAKVSVDEFRLDPRRRAVELARSCAPGTRVRARGSRSGAAAQGAAGPPG